MDVSKFLTGIDVVDAADIVILCKKEVQILVLCTDEFGRIIFLVCTEFDEQRSLDIWLFV